MTRGKSRKTQAEKEDQGSQFTSDGFSLFVLKKGIKLSMDGKGKAIDNAFIERIWRSVKYEKLYLNPTKDGVDLFLPLTEYFNYYNTKRGHLGIDNTRRVI